LLARISLFAVLLLSLGLLQLNLDYLRPQAGDPDSVIVSNALAFEACAEDYLHEARPQGFYPYLLADFLHWLPGPLALYGEEDLDLDQNLERARHQGVLGRRLIGMFGVLSVLMTFLLARRLLRVPWALASSAAVSLNLLMLCIGRTARPHGAEAAMSLLATWTLVRLVEVPSRRRAWQAGLGVGLCIGVLHSGLPITGTLALAFIMLIRAPIKVRHTELAHLISRIGVVAALIILFAYRFIFWNQADGKSASYVVGWSGASRLSEAFWYFDPFLTGALLVGSGFVLCRVLSPSRRGESMLSTALLVASFPLGYVALFIPHNLVWDRHAVPLVPYAAILGMYGMQQLHQLRKPKILQHSVVAACVIGIGVSGYCSTRYVWLSGKPDTATLAARWLGQQRDPPARVVVTSPGFTLPMYMTLQSAQDTHHHLRSDWHKYLRRTGIEFEGAIQAHMLYPSKDQAVGLYGPAMERSLDRQDVDYVVLVRSEGQRARMDPVRKVLRSFGGKIAMVFETRRAMEAQRRTSPTGLVRTMPLAWVWDAERLGRTLEVWRLPQAHDLERHPAQDISSEKQ
jgi:hypothetical protein